MYLKFFSIWRKGPEGLDSWKNGCNNLVDTSCYETVPLNISQLFCWLEHDHYFYPRLLSVPYTLNSGVCTKAPIPSRPPISSSGTKVRWSVLFSLRPEAFSLRTASRCWMLTDFMSCNMCRDASSQEQIQKKWQGRGFGLGERIY